MTVGQTLTPLPGAYAICRLAADAPTPALPAPSGVPGLWSVTRTPDELSVVCRAEDAPAGARVDVPWSVLRLEGPFDLTGQTGILASVVTPLAHARVSVFALATYDTDLVLVPAGRAGQARRALTTAGHTVTVPPVAVRPTTLEDVPALSRFVGEAFLAYRDFAPEDWTVPRRDEVERRMQERLAAYRTTAFVAHDPAGALVGAAGSVVGEQDPGTVFVWQLFVDPGHQGTGLAADLLTRLLDLARADGCARARLAAPRDSPQARAFYARQGFAPVPGGEEEGPGGLPAVLLERAL